MVGVRIGAWKDTLGTDIYHAYYTCIQANSQGAKDWSQSK